MKRLHLPLAALFLFVLNAGCPHRSPLWSPDGKHLLVLAGSGGEEVDKAASQLWLVEVASGKALRLEAPAPETRFLAAAWIDSGSFTVLTASWSDGYPKADSGKLWRRSRESSGASGGWMEVAGAPPPSESRATRRLPVIIAKAEERLVVYPAGDEKVVAASLRGGAPRLELEPAELIGPGPGGGFLVARPEEGDTGAVEVAAFDAGLEVLWKTKLSTLRAEIARRARKQPVEIVFNDTSTSHLPFGEESPDWLGVTLFQPDVNWKEGISGYFVRLSAKDGALLDHAQAIGLSGQPAAAGKLAWAVTAPEPKKSIPAALRAFALEAGAAVRSLPLPELRREQVHGYALDPEGRRLALSINAQTPEVRIYRLEDLEMLGTIELAR
jgi:hypothetical protein